MVNKLIIWFSLAYIGYKTFDDEQFENLKTFCWNKLSKKLLPYKETIIEVSKYLSYEVNLFRQSSIAEINESVNGLKDEIKKYNDSLINDITNIENENKKFQIKLIQHSIFNNKEKK